MQMEIYLENLSSMVYFFFSQVKELKICKCAKRQVRAWGKFFATMISNLRLQAVWNKKNIGL